MDVGFRVVLAPGWRATHLHAAATLLRRTDEQRKEIYRHRRPRAEVMVDCDVNTDGLEEYVGRLAEGRARQAVVRQVQAVMEKAKRESPGRARLRIEYKYSQVGRALVEAGHVTGSRVYAIGVDPFKGWSKELRGAAMHDMGWRRLQQRQGRCTGGTGERSWDRRRVRVPETTLSPRLRASARLLFPGRRPIATRASGPLAARAVGSLSKYGGRRRVRGGGVTRTSK